VGGLHACRCVSCTAISRHGATTDTGEVTAGDSKPLAAASCYRFVGELGSSGLTERTGGSRPFIATRSLQPAKFLWPKADVVGYSGRWKCTGGGRGRQTSSAVAYMHCRRLGSRYTLMTNRTFGIRNMDTRVTIYSSAHAAVTLTCVHDAFE
jgi:hypothetical protein